MKISKSFIWSSSLEDADYDSEMEMLTVKFRGKTQTPTRYIYKRVPMSVAQKFFAAKSSGKYLARYIKPVYDFMKLELYSSGECKGMSVTVDYAK